MGSKLTSMNSLCSKFIGRPPSPRQDRPTPRRSSPVPACGELLHGHAPAPGASPPCGSPLIRPMCMRGTHPLVAGAGKSVVPRQARETPRAHCRDGRNAPVARAGRFLEVTQSRQRARLCVCAGKRPSTSSIYLKVPCKTTQLVTRMERAGAEGALQAQYKAVLRVLRGEGGGWASPRNRRRPIKSSLHREALERRSQPLR